MDADEFDKLIDEALKTKALKKSGHQRTVGRYWCSEIKKCVRASYLDFLGPELKSIDIKQLGIFESAIAAQDKLVEILSTYIAEKFDLEDAVQAETEVKVEIGDGAYLSGRADLLILFPKDETLVEIKSVGYSGALKRLNNDHKYQIMPYLKHYGYTQGLFCYIDRATLAHQSYTQHWDEKIWKECVWRVKEKHYFIQNKEYPPPEAMLDIKMRKQCDWCPWLDVCQDDWEDYNVRRVPDSAILKPLPEES